MMDWRTIMNQQSHPKEQKPQKEQKPSRTKSFATFALIALEDREIENKDEDDVYQFEERAAIMQFDGGLSREEAEKLAKTRQ